IGQALGCGATMTSLLRVKTGAFSLEKSIKLDELRNLAEKGRLNEVLIPVEEAVSDMKRADISPEFAKTAANGVRVPAEMLLFDDLLINDLPVADLPKEGDVLALFAEKKLLGIYDFKENQAVPRRLI
ncbi:MAG: hypothetical protein IJC39_05345, partial [Firmicutes bacterium]|nr:hypothetical protein [Bacillota bacterium]